MHVCILVDVKTAASPATGHVRQIAVPPEARELSTLPRVDYADAFLVEPGLATDETPEEWARSLFDDAPAAMRATLPPGWMSLGLQIGSPRSEELVFGWTVRRSTADLLLLGAESRVGMPGELLLKRHGNALLFATLLTHGNALVRAIWAGVVPGHQQIVRRLLEHHAALRG
jgi:hypothetical protein